VILQIAAGIRNITFLEPIPCIQAVVDDLVRLGIDKIIALGHSGFDYSKKVAREVIGVDVVVDGHTNTFLYNGKAIFTFIPYFTPGVIGEPLTNRNVSYIKFFSICPSPRTTGGSLTHDLSVTRHDSYRYATRRGHCNIMEEEEN
jgi:hypothetical protein